jgi:hypothetical protein
MCGMIPSFFVDLFVLTTGKDIEYVSSFDLCSSDWP